LCCRERFCPCASSEAAIIIADKVLPESQCGFRVLRSTIDTVTVFRKNASSNNILYVAFIDLTKPFDLVSRSVLLAILRRFGCLDTLISIILKLHDGMHETVQVDGSRSRSNFASSRGAFLLLPYMQFASLHCSCAHFRNRLEYYWNVTPQANCLTFPASVQSRTRDDCSFVNCSMKTMLPSW